VVVDNASVDHTAEVVRRTKFAEIESRMYTEPELGVSHARNTALRRAKGDILLFTDDDVQCPRNWIEGMTAPLRSGEADAVAGGVKLAPHLQRSWMNDQNTSILAQTCNVHPDAPQRMIGANMAFSRHVLEKIPSFDTDLGPGRLGLGEESLFSMQLLQAGFRLESRFDIVVEHHCDPHRLSRSAIRSSWKKVGRQKGYIDYHWRHSEEVSDSLVEWIPLGKLYLQLQLERFRSWWGQNDDVAPVTPHEAHLLRTIYQRLQTLKEFGRPRHYDKYGLARKDSFSGDPYCS
jgi:glycosyltransferase involved in cell wall biosynthesis